MAESVNDGIRDDFAEHDIDLRKLDGDVRNKVDAVMSRMAADLKALALKIDPNGAKRLDARKRRIKRLRNESRPIISTAYTEVAAITKHNIRRLAKIESKASLDIIRKQIP